MGATHQTVLETRRGTAGHSERPHRGQASAVKSKPPELGPSGPRWTRCDNRRTGTVETKDSIQEYRFTPTLVTKWLNLICPPGKKLRCFTYIESSCSTPSEAGRDTEEVPRDLPVMEPRAGSEPEDCFATCGDQLPCLHAPCRDMLICESPKDEVAILLVEGHAIEPKAA